MKMRWFDRLLVSLAGLVLAALGVCVVLAGGDVIELPEPFAFDAWLGDGWQWMPLVFLTGVLFIAWGLYLLLKPVFRRRAPASKYYLVKDDAEGDVQISVQAIDHLIHKCLEKHKEILASQVKIGGQENAMRILLTLTVQSDVNIPELVTRVREEIRAFVERSSGVSVERVKVVVEATKDVKGHEPRLLPAHQEDTPAEKQEAGAASIAKNVGGDAPEELEKAYAYKGPKLREPEPDIDMTSFDTEPMEPWPVQLSEEAFPFPEQEVERMLDEEEAKEEAGDA